MRIEPWCMSRIVMGVMAASLIGGCGEQQDEAEPFPEGIEPFPEGIVFAPIPPSEAQPEPETEAVETEVAGDVADLPEAEETTVVGDVVVDEPEAQVAAPETVIEEGEDLPIPTSLSDEVPIMEGFKATRISSTKETGDYHIQGTSSESLADIAAFYNEAAVAKGWEKLPGLVQEATAMANFRKGTRLLQVLMRREGDQSVVSITLGNM